MITLDVEKAVKTRYAKGAAQCESALCCLVEYDPALLKIIPAEVIERDYGCGDPSRYLRPGETVLDLGSGGGKACLIAAQIVGPRGRVIGVDMTDEMLDLARRGAAVVAERLGYANVEFHKGRIQDLGLDLERLNRTMAMQSLNSAEDLIALEDRVRAWRFAEPMIRDAEIDVIISNCVLNLVAWPHREQMFAEMYRVLRDGGRAVIADIICDQPVPRSMREDARLWSGCISGAHTEAELRIAFAKAGFAQVERLDEPGEPWQVEQGIEFHAATFEVRKSVLDDTSSRTPCCG